ncbi:MAG: HAMP domain-containing sensor histidine kinase [Leptolyngbyaceae cyanobacterium bins.349]|nr:HAMP domain-containing sensor histidine kinase [Leptolyngbyaceae cyanobacterium bins.349]
MPKWLLPTLSEVVALSDPTWVVGDVSQTIHFHAPLANASLPNGHSQTRRSLSQHLTKQLRAEREWTGAIAALDELLHQCLNQAISAHTISLSSTIDHYGFVLSGPSPVLSHGNVVKHLSSWTLASPSVHAPHWIGFQLLPADESRPAEHRTNPVLPLLPGDPLAAEQFCLVLTPWFSLVMVRGETLTGEPAFMFSFEPDVVQRSWEAVRPRILLMSSHQVDFLDELTLQFPPVTPDYKTVMKFSRLMLERLPDPVEEGQWNCTGDSGRPVAEAEASNVGMPDAIGDQAPMGQPSPVHAHRDVSLKDWQDSPNGHGVDSAGPETSSFDVELVKAIAHEVRTPLTTIRTLTRSLLKRTDLAADVLRRLGIIDRECSEQIDRFGLIFKAVELESTSTHAASMSLIRTCLSDVFQQSIPRWQQQASQRQMTLTVELPEAMPAVVSDPTVLDQALTSLIERFTRNLPAGSHIQVEVTPAGSQLKVQLQSQPDATNDSSQEHPFSSWKSSAKSIGQMLMFQPETGSLSLNLAVTKNLFQAIGGKLIVKHRPQQGEVMTVYLPLEVGSISPLDGNKIITV